MGYRNKTPFYRLNAFRILMLQASVAVTAALFMFVLDGLVAGYSVLLGAAIVVVANTYFTYKAFKFYGARSAPAIVQSLWAEQMVKFVLAAVLFRLVFWIVKPLEVSALLWGYVLLQVTTAVSLLTMKN